MKRFAFATLAALAAVVASEQQAKAWFNFGLGSSTNLSVSWGGHHRCGNSSEPWPTQALGNPNFNNYGPSPFFPPYYPGANGIGVSGPYGHGYYGAPGYGMPFIGPMPGAGSGSGTGSGSGSGSPTSFNYNYVPPMSFSYGYPATPYGYADVQQAYYAAPAYWYGR
jgi:hypothetical protein